MGKPLAKLETDIVREVLLAVGQRDDCRVWRQNTGGIEYGGAKQSELRQVLALLLAGKLAAAISSVRGILNRKQQTIKFGMKGQADITGVLIVDGLGFRLEIECKSETGRQRKEQADFEKMVMLAGCIYIIVRDAEQAMRLIDRNKQTLQLRMREGAEQ